MPTKARPVEYCATLVPPPELEPRSRERLVAVFRALGDPTRLEVFRLLAAQPDAICVCDIVARFEVSQPTISHHLKILRDAGLVIVARRGVWAYYGVDRAGLALLDGALAELAPAQIAPLA
jgi:DNA-binding transcriptional ArsR family regulator